MPETKVAGRYAKSLLGLAVERKTEKRINDDMQLIANTINSSKELNNLLKNPIINADKKEAIVTAVFGNKIDTVTLSFLKIIINKKREFYIDDIANQFVRMYKEHVGVAMATVTTAMAMDEKLRTEVMNVIKKSVKGEVELKEVVDKDIIGGYILTLKDKQIDASIASKINLLKRDMKINLYQKNY